VVGESAFENSLDLDRDFEQIGARAASGINLNNVLSLKILV
jgi:hypothetical protein